MMENFVSGMFCNNAKFDFLGNWSDIVEAQLHNKDIYAMIASKFYNNNYEYNREFFYQSNMRYAVNPQGQHRRKVAKYAVAAIAYPDMIIPDEFLSEASDMMVFIKTNCNI